METPDGYNEPYHPSVLFFENGWHGYRYWMAFSPMPKKAAHCPYTDRWECPCVYASNDGIEFDVPAGADKILLDDLTDEEINHRDYFSDPHLVYNIETDELELYYRLTNRCDSASNGEVLSLIRKTSKDGLNWSERENLVSSDKKTDIGLIYISPAIIRQNQEYMMWYVSAYGENRSLSIAKSKDMKSFYDVTICSLIGRSCDPWHIDCHKIGKEYVLLVYEFNNELSVWKSKNGVEFCFKSVILHSSDRPGFFYHALYRACITESHNGGYNLYFSAQNSKEMCLGIAIWDGFNNCQIVSGNGKKDYQLFWTDILNKYFYIIVKIILKCRGKFYA